MARTNAPGSASIDAMATLGTFIAGSNFFFAASLSPLVFLFGSTLGE
jgi:hypothetical protein